MDRSLRQWLLVLAITAGVGVANVYYNQPLLSVLRASFPDCAQWIGTIPTTTQIGFAVGMVLLAPLGDRFDRRLLILLQIVGLCVALFLFATATTLSVLIGASFGIGLFSTLSQRAAPFAVQLAPQEQRGYAVGIVMSGILLGILMGRTVAGCIAADFGWRVVFFAAIVFMGALALVIFKCLPSSRPTSTLPYGRLVCSPWQLFFELRGLREASLTGACNFAAFSVFWTVLALLLARPPFHMGPEVAGLFGIIGITGVFIAPWAGRFSDSQGPRMAISFGLGVIALSYVILIFSDSSIGGLIIGVIVLDIGIHTINISNQSRVFALKPEARSRLHTVYMTSYFIGGGAGSAAGMAAWEIWGWTGVCAMGFLFCAIAAGNHFDGWRAAGFPQKIAR